MQADPAHWNEARAREALALVPPEGGPSHTGLDEPIPDRCDLHPAGCPRWNVDTGELDAAGAMPWFPTRYLTPGVLAVCDLYALHREGVPPIPGPSSEWPGTLVLAFRILRGAHERR